jgi:hypothetical protein
MAYAYNADAVGQLSQSVGLTMGVMQLLACLLELVCVFKCGIPTVVRLHDKGQPSLTDSWIN